MGARARTDACLLSLAFAGGALDAISYLGLGRVFVANMTGNTVLLAVALARSSGAEAARSSVALGGFCLGVAVGAAVTHAEPRSWPRSVRGPLMLELLALAALLALWAAIGVGPIRYLLIGLGGVVMGVQSAAVRASDVRGVNTTYMTSTLMQAVVRLVHRLRRRPRGEEGPSLPGAAWLTYGAGAVAAAFAVGPWRAGAVAIPLAFAGAVAVVAALPAGSEGWPDDRHRPSSEDRLRAEQR